MTKKIIVPARYQVFDCLEVEVPASIEINNSKDLQRAINKNQTVIGEPVEPEYVEDTIFVRDDAEIKRKYTVPMYYNVEEEVTIDVPDDLDLENQAEVIKYCDDHIEDIAGKIKIKNFKVREYTYHVGELSEIVPATDEE